jgi:hypothetical protein
MRFGIYGQLNATAAPFAERLAAAMATPEFRSIRHMFGKAGLDIESVFPTNGGPITVAALDGLLSHVHSGLTTVNRIELKNTLLRLGLLE